MNHHPVPTGLPAHRFPVEPWRLVECEYAHDDLGLTETIFAVGNGYLGMRANPEEGREAHSHGTFVNGFHETWTIQHAEDAFGFAKTGQTIVNVPDAKLMKLYVDDEPLLLAGADLDSYERTLDFRTGVLTRDLVWRTPGGKRVRVRSQRMVSFTHRHLAVMTFEITLLDAGAPVVVSSQLLNRQDGEDEYHVRSAALGEGMDPRKARKFLHRVLRPILQRERENEIVLGYRCANSGMTLACGTRHLIETSCQVDVTTDVSADLAKTGQTIVNVPDAKLMKLYVDDEPLLLAGADLDEYERSLDFRTGVLTRDLVWRTPAGKRVRVRSQRMVSITHRHLAVMTFEITLLDSTAPVVLSSQLLNRQDGEDEYHVTAAALGEGGDPRKTRPFGHRVLLPRLHRDRDGEAMLGYRCANSGMTLACGTRHLVDSVS
ncbi:MAG: hypothetical protein ABWZ99_15645, partial [Ilumatobacteraceae bacterium]